MGGNAATVTGREPAPLEPADPPRLGGFWLSSRLVHTAAGAGYAGRDEDGRRAVVVHLSDGAAGDPAARARFLAAVDRLGRDQTVEVYDGERDAELAPWVALAAGDGRGNAVARSLLSSVLLDRLPPVGRRRGPDFVPHWFRRNRPGPWRIWPLTWPRELMTASRRALLWPMLAVVALATLAVLVALWLFDGAPPAPPPPPFPSPSPTPTPSPTESPSSPSPSGPSSSPSPSGPPSSPGTSPGAPGATEPPDFV